MQGVSRLPASYADMACMSLVVIRSLCLPVWTPEAAGVDGHWATTERPLIGNHLVGFWTCLLYTSDAADE
eukprot:16447069-Heterocapsa_arctica.AAC.1